MGYLLRDERVVDGKTVTVEAWIARLNWLASHLPEREARRGECDLLGHDWRARWIGAPVFIYRAVCQACGADAGEVDFRGWEAWFGTANLTNQFSAACTWREYEP